MIDFDHELSRLDGLYVGQLSDSEMKLFTEAVKENKAYREYNGPSGLLGLAKVRVRSSDMTRDEQIARAVIEAARAAIIKVFQENWKPSVRLVLTPLDDLSPAAIVSALPKQEPVIHEPEDYCPECKHVNCIPGCPSYTAPVAQPDAEEVRETIKMLKDAALLKSGLEPAIVPTGKAADAFWKYWRENGETHKHGYYESTWGAINAALRTSGVTMHDYHTPLPQEKGRSDG